MTERVVLENCYPTEQTKDETCVTQVRAKWDFDTTDDNQISFPAGTIIDITAQYPVENQWWGGSFDGKQGLFPINRTEVYQIEKIKYKKISLRLDGVSDSIRLIQNQIKSIHENDKVIEVKPNNKVRPSVQSIDFSKQEPIENENTVKENSKEENTKEIVEENSFEDEKQDSENVIAFGDNDNSTEGESTDDESTTDDISSESNESSELTDNSSVDNIIVENQNEEDDNSENKEESDNNQVDEIILPKEGSEEVGSESESSKKDKNSEKSEESEKEQISNDSSKDEVISIEINEKEESEKEETISDNKLTDDLGEFLEEQAKETSKPILSSNSLNEPDMNVDFWEACSLGYLSRVKELVEKQKQDIHQEDNEGNTGLHRAVSKGKYDVILYLLSKNANVGVINNVQQLPHTQPDCKQATRQVLLENLKQEPNWIPDDISDSCLICSSKFTFFFRRHHCRNCGVLACGNCTNKKTAIPNIYGNQTKQRVCSYCHPILTALK